VLEYDRTHQDFLVYPFCYCLRHALELALKQVIRGARILTDDEERGFPYLHDLGRLWATCSPVLKRIWPDDGTEPGYAICERTIEAFRRVDPTGEAFRYPVGRKPESTLNPDLRDLDMTQLYRDAKATLDLLMGADAGIDHYMDLKDDMEAESRQIEAEMRAEYQRDYGYDAGSDYSRI
jgi:hypothetical protein